jgi:hypothetical protein
MILYSRKPFTANKIVFVLWTNFLSFYYWTTNNAWYNRNPIGGDIVSVLDSSVVDHRFESWLCQPKDYKIGICFYLFACSIKEQEQHMFGSKSE